MQYETKDSGVRASFSNGGVRDTQEGKPRFDLIFPKNVPYEDQLITRVAELMARGAEKYEDRNWEQFSDPEARDRAMGSALRHLIQWYNGADDEDHGAAVVFNIMAGDYVRGVLEGKWPAIKAAEETVTLTQSDLRPASLWRGWSGENPPPSYVDELRLINPRTDTERKSRLVRAWDNLWYWTAEPYEEHELAQSGDFEWFTAVGSTYHLEEVRR